MRIANKLVISALLLLPNLISGAFSHDGEPIPESDKKQVIGTGHLEKKDHDGLPGRARIDIAGPFQNLVREAYRCSARFRTILDRLQAEPGLELTIGRPPNRRERSRFDRTIIRIYFGKDGCIERLKARVEMNPGSSSTLIFRLGHELAHVEEILDKQMGPGAMARDFPDQAYAVKGYLSHYETYYALEVESIIAAEVRDPSDDLLPERLQNLEAGLFASMPLSMREQRKRERYYRKLAEKRRPPMNGEAAVLMAAE
ncbi:MAG: hypothetical protein QNK37_26590 [Acidobacteriota bacterium]|nr:hypothetical protein [Acidobacteriota bacterium]